MEENKKQKYFYIYRFIDKNGKRTVNKRDSFEITGGYMDAYQEIHKRLDKLTPELGYASYFIAGVYIPYIETEEDRLLSWEAINARYGLNKNK